TRLFRVDMSEGSRDFSAVATEPGLPMLDAAGANYTILRRWCGALVAEPELQTPELTSFYVRDQERGRLENLTCLPATVKDLRGPLKPELEALEAGIRKAKPESSNERVLHRIVVNALKDQTADLDTSDFHCYFFKYRQPGKPWQLVWCWGYQRRDEEPSQAVICTNPDCQRLFAQRPKTKRRCPACQTIAQKKKTPLLGVGGSWGAVLALLAIIAGLLVVLFPPRLVATPAAWTGPPGSRVRFRVTEKKWLLFNSDVTDQVTPQTDDTRVMQFDAYGTSGHANASGQTQVGFRLGDRLAVATVSVGAAVPPQSIKLEPAAVKLAVGSTAPLIVSGKYISDAPAVDVTETVEWQVSDPKVAFVRGGRVQGLAAGKAQITARYPQANGAPLEATSSVEVLAAEYQKLEIKLVPADVAVGRTSKVEVTGIDAGGQRYDLSGSTDVSLAVDPDAIVSLAGDYVLGRAPGKGKVTATLGKIAQSLEFNVQGDTAALSVRPAAAEMIVGEFLDVDISGNGAADAKSETSDPNIVTVVGARTLSAHKAGQAEVRFMPAGGTTGSAQVVKVTVKPAEFRSVEIRPAAIALSVGESKRFDVVGIMPDGRSISLAPDQLTWLRQPQGTNIELDRTKREVRGLAVTTAPQELQVQYGTLPPATATVAVVASPVAVAPDVWGVYPPVTLRRPGTVVDVGPNLGGPLRYVEGQGLIADKIAPGSPLELAGIVPGTRIQAIDGKDISKLTPAELAEWFKTHPLANGNVLSIADADGKVRDVKLGLDARVSQLPVQVLGITPGNVTATAFNAAVKVYVREKAEYRVVDEAGKPLSEWSMQGPAVEATLNVTQIPRAANRNEYEMVIERRLGSDVKRYPFVISLSPK
ncbi:MAG: Ig-like domain-containing protein, partial [Planctomycetia bacterium]|nr:Ig-like domain-containing protein [Planctomycetia bacterium]